MNMTAKERAELELAARNELIDQQHTKIIRLESELTHARAEFDMMIRERDELERALELSSYV